MKKKYIVNIKKPFTKAKIIASPNPTNFTLQEAGHPKIDKTIENALDVNIAGKNIRAMLFQDI